MLPRVLEPEVMDSPEEARDYDGMDHAAVNRAFAADFLAFRSHCAGTVLDVGTGTAHIPIELCWQAPTVRVLAVDAAPHMLAAAVANVERAGLTGRVVAEKADAKRLPYRNGTIAAVVSNSLVHHIPEPSAVFAEMARVCAPGGVLFVRDLLRPADEEALARLVNTYAAGANDHQRAMFTASLWAALTAGEVRELVGRLGFPPDSVRQTSDRHWTWAVTR